VRGAREFESGGARHLIAHYEAMALRFIENLNG
jgi:hypothetical protein